MELNEQQRLAVEHSEGPLLIIAGAGSGKTRVLTARIASLVQSGVPISSILAVTFTNKAADEMKRRVEGLIDMRIYDLSIGTFHSTCLKILRKEHEAAGLSPNFIVYDQADQLSQIKRILKEMNIDDKRFPPKAVLDRIMRAKDSCISAADFEKSADNFYSQCVAKIFLEYHKRLKEAHALDFGDLIFSVVQLFKDKSLVLKRYQDRWRYLLVDEYQDTNHAQYQFLKLISSEHRNLCVVGDEDQSIYRWRGADISNILNFEKDFVGAKVVKLEENYRSTKIILDAANALITNNPNRKDKNLWTRRVGGNPISVVMTPSEDIEARYLADSILKLKESNVKFSDIVIFYRINAQSRAVEERFRESSIPYRIYGGVKFYERKEIKDILAYLRLALDPNDNVSLLRIINEPARGVGKTSIDKLLEHSRLNSTSIFISLKAGDAVGLKSKALTNVRALHDLILKSHELVASATLPDFVDFVLCQSGYLEALNLAKTIDAQTRIENINELVNAVNESKTKNLTLSEFLDQVSLVTAVDEYNSEDGAVSLMTLHLAKGLEFPHVYMIGMDEGVLPHERSLEDPEELEEERRLCYVGITRAIDSLTMLSASKRNYFGTTRYSVISRFIDEIPSELQVKHNLMSRPTYSPQSFNPYPNFRGINKVNRTEDFSENRAVEQFMEFDQRPAEEIISKFSVGSKVSHPDLGIGLIKSSEKTEMGNKVTVLFRGGVVKRLIAEYAGLTKA